MNTVFVQKVEKHIPLTPGHRHMKVAREAILQRAPHNALGRDVKESFPQSVPKRHQSAPALFTGLRPNLQGNSEGYSAGCIHGPRARTLLISTVMKGLHVQGVPG
jgi:hypothetical protein